MKLGHQKAKTKANDDKSKKNATTICQYCLAINRKKKFAEKKIRRINYKNYLNKMLTVFQLYCLISTTQLHTTTTKKNNKQKTTQHIKLLLNNYTLLLLSFSEVLVLLYGNF